VTPGSQLNQDEPLTESNQIYGYNYLKATEMEVGLLLNFGPKPEFARKIFTNGRKGRMERG